MATETQKREFYNAIGAIAQKICRNNHYPNAVLWTCMAQAADESAYGTSKIMRNAHAYFGIKANKYWIEQAKYGGLVYDAHTKECYDGKTYVSIYDNFRAYRSMEDSVADYFDLLNYNRYKACLTKQTVRECITVIKNGGYATAPDYVNTITNNFYMKDRALIEAWRVDGNSSPAASSTQVSISYQTGRTYTLQEDMRVRLTPNGEKKLYSELTVSGKKNGVADSDGYAILKKGTIVTNKGITKVGKSSWMKIPSGYVCAISSDGKIYIK